MWGIPTLQIKIWRPCYLRTRKAAEAEAEAKEISVQFAHAYRAVLCRGPITDVCEDEQGEGQNKK